MDIDIVVKNFKKNKIKVTVLEDSNELLCFLKNNMPAHSVVGVGDSVTLETTGVYDFLRRETYTFLDKYDERLTKEEKRNIYLKNFDADFFLSSVNAISANGCLFNIDGNGSRVAPMLYGPRKVYLIAGTNKMVDDEQSVLERMRTIAAPLDNIRCAKNNPCVKAGHCVDCKSKTKICNYFTKIQGQFDENRIELILLKGEYGY
jgi:Uncharacterised ACR, YkgG family COG1556.